VILPETENTMKLFATTLAALARKEVKGERHG